MMSRVLTGFCGCRVRTERADNSGVTQKRSFPIGLVVILLASLIAGAGMAALVLLSNNTLKNTGGSGGILSMPTSTRILRAGQPAPEWTLKAFDGKPLHLSDTKGKPVLINFWASWCPPCKEETPALVAAYNELKTEGRAVEFIGIGTNDPSLDALRKFATDSHVSYPLVYDADDKVSEAYAVLGMPTTVILDRNGTVHQIFMHALTKDEVLGIMRALT